MRLPGRSVVVAVAGGMMAAGYLHTEGIVDLSFGLPRGGLTEGVLMAISGALAGYVVLVAFRALRGLAARGRK